MSLDVRIVRAMADAGATIEVIIAAMEVAQAIDEEKAEARRKYERERKRAYRERLSKAVPDCPGDLPSPKKERSPPIPPSKEKTPLPSYSASIEKFPIREAFDNWNILAEACRLPMAREFTPQRQRRLNCVLQAYGLEKWNEALENIQDQPWLMGKNERGWKVDLEFMLGEKFVKVLEKSYVSDNTRADQQRASRYGSSQF